MKYFKITTNNCKTAHKLKKRTRKPIPSSSIHFSLKSSLNFIPGFSICAKQIPHIQNNFNYFSLKNALLLYAVHYIEDGMPYIRGVTIVRGCINKIVADQYQCTEVRKRNSIDRRFDKNVKAL